MARIKGPFLSIDASGQLGKTLVASNLARAPYMSRYHKPNANCTFKQGVVRDKYREAIFTFNNLSSKDIAYWEQQTNKKSPSVLSAYLPPYYKTRTAGPSANKLPDGDIWFGLQQQSKNYIKMSGILKIKTTGPYIYGTYATSPNALFRISKYFPDDVIIKQLPGYSQINPLIIEDGNITTFGQIGTQRNLLKFSTPNMQEIYKYNLGATISSPTCMTYDNQYYYWGSLTGPAHIYKILRTPPHTITDQILTAGSNTASDICVDGQYIWITLRTSPGQLIRMDKTNPAIFTTYTLPAGNNDLTGILDDGTNIWAAINTNISKYVIFPKSNPAAFSIIGFGPPNNKCYQLEQDNNFVYLSVTQLARGIVRISKFIPGWQIFIPTDKNIGTYGEMTSDNSVLYISTLNPELGIIKFWK